MPSVVRAGLFAYVYWQRINVRYIHNGRGHKKSLFANISRVCFTYAAAKVLLFFDIRKDFAK